MSEREIHLHLVHPTEEEQIVEVEEFPEENLNKMPSTVHIGGVLYSVIRIVSNPERVVVYLKDVRNLN